LIYGVVVQFSSVGRIDAGIVKAQAASDKWLGSLHTGARSAIDAFNGAFDSVGSSFVSTLSTAGALAGAALAAGVTKALHEGVNFNSFQEQAVIGIASVRSMLGNVPFDQALAGSESTVTNLTKLAKELPGTVKELVNSYSFVQPAILGTGLNIDAGRQETFAAQSIAAAAAVGVNQGTAGHEIAAMIEGRATSKMPMVAKLGLHAKELNAMDPLKRFETIESRFSKLGPAIDAYKHSWAGLTSNLTDTASQVAGTFAAPLFESVKRELSRGLDWFGQHEDEVHRWASRLGHYVSWGFDRGLEAIHRWQGPVTTFAHTLYDGVSRAFGVAGPYLAKLERLALGFMQDPRALDKLTRTAGMLLALRAGTGAVSAGLSGASALAPLVSGLAGSSGAAAGLVAMGPAALAGAAAVGAFALGTYGAVGALTDGSSVFHDAAVGYAEAITVQTASTVGSFDRLAKAAKPATDAFGTYYLLLTDTATKGVALFTDHLALTAEGLRGVWGWGEKFLTMLGYLDGPIFDPAKKPARAYDDELWRDPDRDGREDMTAPRHVTNIHGGIHNTIQVETNADPNRIAVVTKDLILKSIERANVSPSAGLYR
jgi:hypothetical protein